eukprot:scaffold4768_cov412-Prasinococcus_capsulatus_cf.AAC.16
MGYLRPPAADKRPFPSAEVCQRCGRGGARVPVPFSPATAPVTPSMAKRPWMISLSAFFSGS